MPKPLNFRFPEPDVREVSRWHAVTLEYKKGSVTAVCSCGAWRCKGYVPGTDTRWLRHEQMAIMAAVEETRPILRSAIQAFGYDGVSLLPDPGERGYSYDDLCRAYPALAEARRLIPRERIAEVHAYQFVDYGSVYNRTVHWVQTARLTKERAGWRCEASENGVRCTATQALDAHHPVGTYDFVGFELPEQLRALCRRHHRVEHPDKSGATSSALGPHVRVAPRTHSAPQPS